MGDVEILQQVCAYTLPHYRPMININANVDDHLITLMEECWVEDPMARPDFSAIAVLFGGFGKHKFVFLLFSRAVSSIFSWVLMSGSR